MKLKDKALMMIGYNPDGVCVYSAYMSIHDYDDADHPWDDEETVKSMLLKRVHGYLFDNQGSLEQEFECHFNLESGIFENGWSRNSEGIINND